MVESSRGKHDQIALSSFLAAILLGTAVLTYVLGLANGRESERREQIPATYSQAAQADAQRACVGRHGIALFECVYERVESSQEQARAEQDLSAQQRAAASALASAIIALLALAVTIIGVWFIKRTLDATLQAVKDTSEATHAMRDANQIAAQAQRPWLELTVTPVAYYRFKDDPEIRDLGTVIFKITIKNIGGGVATNIKRLSLGHIYTKITDDTKPYPMDFTHVLSSGPLMPSDSQVDMWMPVDLNFANIKGLADDKPLWVNAVIRIDYEFAGEKGRTQKGFLISRPGMEQIIGRDTMLQGSELGIGRKFELDEVL